MSIWQILALKSSFDRDRTASIYVLKFSFIELVEKSQNILKHNVYYVADVRIEVLGRINSRLLYV